MSDTTENNHNESVEGLSMIQRLIGIIISPNKTFSYIKEKPDWIIPLLVAITISLSVQIVIKPYFFNSKQYETTIIDLMEKADMDRESAEEMMQKNITIAMPLFALIGTPLILLLLSGAMFLGGNLVMGGETSFKHLFSINAYVGIVGAVGMLLTLPLIMAKGSTDILTSLAILMPPEADETILYKLLSLFDVIVIWESVVAAIGLAIIYNWAQKKANMLVIGMWLVVIIVYGLVLLIS